MKCAGIIVFGDKNTVMEEASCNVVMGNRGCVPHVNSVHIRKILLYKDKFFMMISLAPNRAIEQPRSACGGRILQNVM